jgi:hypothetical protein
LLSSPRAMGAVNARNSSGVNDCTFGTGKTNRVAGEMRCRCMLLKVRRRRRTEALRCKIAKKIISWNTVVLVALLALRIWCLFISA